jgi:hypothetical protein
LNVLLMRRFGISLVLGAVMPLDTDFQFNHIQPDLTARPVSGIDLLGPLRGFVGAKKQRRWEGAGFNLIWRPNHGPGFGGQDFFLELNLTHEKLSFTDITGPTGVANRGELQDAIFLGGLGYLQEINDFFLEKQHPEAAGLHFEPGVWGNVPATKDPNEKRTVVRMGSIPHGTTINLQGVSVDTVAPKIDRSSIVPFAIGSLDDGKTGLKKFNEAKAPISSNLPSRTPLAQVPGLTDQQFVDPNLFLTQANAGLTFLKTTLLVLTSDVKAPKSPPNALPDAPDVGGGTDNIAFLAGKANPNANVPIVTATFWIEHVRDKHGKEFDQLQYTQRVLLDFNGLSWPHITVATLKSI